MSGSPEVSSPGLMALLGPTNTGKTHHAVERMLTHPTGMMGLPLRLLAREIYDRVSARFGEAAFPGAPKKGFTWTASPGAPVLAPAAGIVEYAGPLKDYGVILILRTGGAYHLVLTGLGAAEAVVGTTVAAGEPVGRMGEEAAASPSLYLEMRKGDDPVLANPLADAALVHTAGGEA